MTEPPEKKKYRHCSEMRRYLGIEDEVREHPEGQERVPPARTQPLIMNELIRVEPMKMPHSALFMNELIRVEPMKMPDLKILSMGFQEDAKAEEDIVCRTCEKLIVPKGELLSSALKTTHYLSEISESTGNPVWNGELVYSCHDCEPPKKRKLRGRPHKCTR